MPPLGIGLLWYSGCGMPSSGDGLIPDMVLCTCASGGGRDPCSLFLWEGNASALLFCWMSLFKTSSSFLFRMSRVQSGIVALSFAHDLLLWLHGEIVTWSFRELWSTSLQGASSCMPQVAQVQGEKGSISCCIFPPNIRYSQYIITYYNAMGSISH